MTAVLMIVIAGFSTASAARTNRHQAKMQIDDKLNAMGNVSTSVQKKLKESPSSQEECPFGRKADANGDCFTGCPENSEGPDGRGNCVCIQDMRCFDTSVPEEPLIPDLVDEPISGSKLPAVFEEDKSKVLLGTAVRFKRVAVIDVQIYALAVYGQYKKILGGDGKSADEMMNALLTSQEDKVLSLVFLRAVTGQQAGDGLADGLMKIGGATQEDIDEFKKHLPPQIPKGSEMRFVMKPKLGEMEFRCSVAPEGKVNLKLPSLNPAMHKVMFGPQSVVTGLPDSLLRQGQMNAARDRQGSGARSSPATQQTGWCKSTHMWKFCERNRHMDKATCDEHDKHDCVWVEGSPDLKVERHILLGCSTNQPKKFGHTCEGCHCKARSGASTVGLGFPAAVSFLVLALEMLQ